MKKYILIYGSISGLVVIGSMVIGMVASGGEGAAAGEAFGYLVMLIAFSLIFVAIKQYRDKDLGGVISFGKALLLGVAISAVAGVAYVIVWEIYLSVTDYRFMDDYVAGQLARAKESGMSSGDLAAKVAQLDAMKESYSNPLIRMPMTFAEIFPVGLLVSLVSAGILKNRRALPA